MGRRLLEAFAADIASFGATAVVLAAFFGVWHVVGVPSPRHDAGAEAPARPDVGSVAAPSEPEGAGGVDVALPATGPHGRRGLNVILITVDTLRFDLGYMGYPRPVSPNIDALAARSVVFERAYAMASFTPKCLGPLLIGRYVSETHRDYEHYTNFYPANVFVAERIQAAGGHTVGAASHRYFGWKKGFDQGFDVWDTSAIPPRSIDNDPTITSERLTDAAIALLSAGRASEIPVRPRLVIPKRDGTAKGHFFAWFHYLDPHLPYVRHDDAPSFAPTPGERIPRERTPYDGEVWYTDKQIGRLLRHIAAQPWATETAIIFTADHGEAFGEHGHWGHGRELWEPLVRVPLLLFIPGTEPRRIQIKRSHIDVVPTILELMGVSGDDMLRGKSLVPDTTTPSSELEERDVYIDMPEGPYNDMRRAIIHGPSPGMKLIDFGRGKYELFDLRVDPNEQRNLAFDRARVAAATQAMARVRGGLKELPPAR